MFLGNSVPSRGSRLGSGMQSDPDMAKWWSSLTSLMALLAFLHTVIPPEFKDYLTRLCRDHLPSFLSSRYLYVTVAEYEGAATNELFTSVQLYLSASASLLADNMNVALPKNASKPTFSLGNHDTIDDQYEGAAMHWQFRFSERTAARGSDPWKYVTGGSMGSFRLRLLRSRHQHLLQPYLEHIVETAKELKRRNKERMLYTNTRGSPYSYRKKLWKPVPFQHSASFDTLALEPSLKERITHDLIEFAKGEEFYKRAGRAWKRRYLLYGPPGTGKTTMIAAIANFLEYEVYDLELTEVKDNGELRQLLLNTEDKSVIVIEDIDCSLDLSDRAKKKKKEKDPSVDGPPSASSPEEKSQVTLSGLLNFTDGIWSCCGHERIIVFTTNHVEKLDPALLRPGRMDMHIHLSFCTFAAFKALARTYLQIEDEEHHLFPAIEEAIAEAKMSPADVSEVLTKRRLDPDIALADLLHALQENKKKQLLDEQKKLQVSSDESPNANGVNGKAIPNAIGVDEKANGVSGKAIPNANGVDGKANGVDRKAIPNANGVDGKANGVDKNAITNADGVDEKAIVNANGVVDEKGNGVDQNAITNADGVDEKAIVNANGFDERGNGANQKAMTNANGVDEKARIIANGVVDEKGNRVDQNAITNADGVDEKAIVNANGVDERGNGADQKAMTNANGVDEKAISNGNVDTMAGKKGANAVDGSQGSGSGEPKGGTSNFK